jgi:hypothetical protein
VKKPLKNSAGVFNVCIRGEAATQGFRPLPLTHGRKYHLYCSPSCKGALTLANELNDLTPIQWTDQLDALVGCEHFLLHLTSTTWTSGEVSAQFAREVCEAHRLGVHLLLAHEFPSMLDNADTSQRGACAFNDFWNDGWTPKYLLKGDANVYKQIAIALKPGEWRKAGLVTVLDKMRTFDGERKVINMGPCDSLAPASYEPKGRPDEWLAVAPPSASLSDSSTSLPANQRATAIIAGKAPHLVGERRSHKYDALLRARRSAAPTNRIVRKGALERAGVRKGSIGDHQLTGANAKISPAAELDALETHTVKSGH